MRENLRFEAVFALFRGWPGALFLFFALCLPLNLTHEVFPQARFRATLTSGEMIEKAWPYYQAFDPIQNKEALRVPSFFHFDSQAGFYFQQSFGDESTNSHYRAGRLPFFFWVVRFVQEGNPHEYRVYLGPDGRPVGYRWLPPEEYEIPETSEEEARLLASSTLSRLESPDQWELFDFQMIRHPRRKDFLFTFREKRLFEEASHRLLIQVSGDRVLHVRRVLQVPEKYQKSFRRSDALADLLVQGSVFLDILLVFAALAVFLRAHKSTDLDFAPALKLALLVYVVLVLSILNYLPNLVAFRYLPEKNFLVFILSQFLNLAVLAFIPAFACFLFLLAGRAIAEPLGETAKFDTLLLLLSGRVTPRVSQSIFAGLLFALVLGGAETFFYLVAMRFGGVWIPLRNDLANSLGTWLPLFLPLSIGVAAGITEEIVFRAFAVTFFRERGAPLFFALLIPAIAWGFAHSYEWVFPVYVRGTELVLGGLLFGYFYLKTDLLAAIVAHYWYDVVAFGWPLLVAGGAVDVTMGLAVILAPLAPALFGLVGGGGDHGGDGGGVQGG